MNPNRDCTGCEDIDCLEEEYTCRFDPNDKTIDYGPHCFCHSEWQCTLNYLGRYD